MRKRQPKFSKRHYVAIAKLISGLPDHGPTSKDRIAQPDMFHLTVGYVARQFATMLKRDNPRFREPNFIDACMKQRIYRGDISTVLEKPATERKAGD